MNNAFTHTDSNTVWPLNVWTMKICTQIIMHLNIQKSVILLDSFSKLNAWLKENGSVSRKAVLEVPAGSMYVFHGNCQSFIIGWV